MITCHPAIPQPLIIRIHPLLWILGWNKHIAKVQEEGKGDVLCPTCRVPVLLYE